MALNIKQAIKSRGLRVKEVADRMGISPVSLSYHINGNPSVEVLGRIASAIGCSIPDLFDDGGGPEAKGAGEIICPHCGKPIKLNPSR